MYYLSGWAESLMYYPIQRRGVVRIGSNGSMSLREDRSDRTANLQFNVGAKQVLMVVEKRWR